MFYTHHSYKAVDGPLEGERYALADDHFINDGGHYRANVILPAGDGRRARGVGRLPHPRRHPRQDRLRQSRRGRRAGRLVHGPDRRDGPRPAARVTDITDPELDTARHHLSSGMVRLLGGTPDRIVAALRAQMLFGRTSPRPADGPRSDEDDWHQDTPGAAREPLD